MGLDIKCYPKGMYGENTYLITDEATGLKAIIDPGYIGSDIKADIGDGSDLKYVLLTHGHHDHFFASKEYMSTYEGLEFEVPEKDLIVIENDPYDCADPTVLLKEGDVIKLGETEFTVIETPGHTGGCICFFDGKELFSGDTLFRLSVGRTDLFTGDWEALQESVRTKLYSLDEDVVVYPGHGAPTTIGFEKRANPFV